jgi:hypothetical protein
VSAGLLSVWLASASRSSARPERAAEAWGECVSDEGGVRTVSSRSRRARSTCSRSVPAPRGPACCRADVAAGAGRAFGVARFFEAFGAGFWRVTFRIAGFVDFDDAGAPGLDELVLRAGAGRGFALREEAARVPREVVGRVVPPPLARLRAGGAGRGVLRLAMTHPFLANLDSFPISNVSSIAYRD